jgi:hypothetical protein
MKVVDKRGVWITNTSQFRMHDPMSDTYFEPGEPTKAENTAWRKTNFAIIKLTDDEGTQAADAAKIAAGEAPVEAPAEAVTEAVVDTAKAKK